MIGATNYPLLLFHSVLYSAFASFIQVADDLPVEFIVQLVAVAVDQVTDDDKQYGDDHHGNPQGEAHGAGHAAFNHGPGRFSGQIRVNLFRLGKGIDYLLVQPRQGQRGRHDKRLDGGGELGGERPDGKDHAFIPGAQLPVPVLDGIGDHDIHQEEDKSLAAEEQQPGSPYGNHVHGEYIAGAKHQQETGNNGDGRVAVDLFSRYFPRYCRSQGGSQQLAHSQDAQEHGELAAAVPAKIVVEKVGSQVYHEGEGDLQQQEGQEDYYQLVVFGYDLYKVFQPGFRLFGLRIERFFFYAHHHQGLA